MKLRNILAGIVIGAISIAASVDSSAEMTEKTLSISTASQGGAWYGIAARVFKDVEKAAPGLTVQVQPGGAIGNVRKLDEGATDIGFSQDFVAGLAYQGAEPFKQVRKNVTFLAKVFPGYTKIITVKDAGIKNFEDLFSKRVTGGKNGWASEFLFRMVLSAYDMDYDKIKANGGVVNFVGTGQAAQMMRDGNLDAMFITGNPPVHPVFKELSTTTPIDVLDLGPDGLKKVFDKYPFLSPITLPKNIYPGVEAGFDTIGGNVLMLSRRSLSDDAAYLVVKTFYDNLDAIKGDMRMLEENTLKEALKGIPIDVHPGAARYYKEKGLM
jgi:hypothetical protein